MAASLMRTALPVALGLRIDTVKVGVGFRWGGPIVARY